MKKTLWGSTEGIAFKGDCLQKKHIGTQLWGVVNFSAQLLICQARMCFPVVTCFGPTSSDGTDAIRPRKENPTLTSHLCITLIYFWLNSGQIKIGKKSKTCSPCHEKSGTFLSASLQRPSYTPTSWGS